MIQYHYQEVVFNSIILSCSSYSEVNFDLSNPDGEPCQQYIIENTINGTELAVEVELCYYNNKSVEVLSFIANKEKEVCDF